MHYIIVMALHLPCCINFYTLPYALSTSAQQQFHLQESIFIFLFMNAQLFENSMHTNQLASEEASCSVSTLFD